LSFAPHALPSVPSPILLGHRSASSSRPKEPTMSKSEFFMRELIGQSPDFPQDLILKCARAQLIIAGADGLSPQEEEDCHGIGRLLGASEETVKQAKAFDYKKA